MAFGRNRIKHDALPRFSGAHYWTRDTVGRQFGELAASRLLQATNELKRLPGTISDDLNAVIRAGAAIIELSRDLDKVDEALQRASHLELQSCLFATPGCEQVPYPGSWQFDSDLAGAYAPVHERMLAWADGLPESERLQAQTWIEERRERALSLFEMSASFVSTTRAIADSYLRYKTTQSVAALGSSPTQTRLSLEHEMDKVRSAAGVASVIGAAVDAVCPPAPKLAELDVPPAAVASPDSSLPSLELS
jgi:hypothetical protein